jgi:hypothetical protein
VDFLYIPGKIIEGNRSTKSNDVKLGWFNHVHKKMSIVALGMGLGIGFGGVVGMFIMWEKSKLWFLGPIRPQPFFGMY